MSVSDVPLLNDYKQEYVKKRLPQTFLGGPNLKLGYQAPCYIYLLQILVWILPFIFGGICTILTEIARLNIILSGGICAAWMGLFVLIVQKQLKSKLYFHKNNLDKIKSQIVHFFKSDQYDDLTGKSTRLTASQQLHQLLADDDEIDFDSFCSFTTFKFIFPRLRFGPSIIYHVLFSAALCGFGVWYTALSALVDLYGNSIGAAIIVYVFSWITICTAQYPLNSCGIPEVATFHSVDAYDVASLSRAFHVFLFYAFLLIEMSVPSFQAVNQVLHVLFIFLPFFWLIGLLPPIDSLALWIAEQCLVFGFGGSPCATDLRLFVSLILSGAVLAGTSFLTTLSALVPVTAAFGFLLSTDFVSLLCFSFSKLTQCCSSNFARKLYVHFNSHFRPSNIFAHLFVALFLGLTVALAVVYHQEAIANITIITAFEITFIVLLFLTKLIQDVQRVYIFFRHFRNKVYPERSTASISRNKSTLVFGWIFRILTNVISPLLMSSYLSLFLFSSDTDIFRFFGAVGALHAFRMVWQRSNSALVVFAVLSILRLIVAFTNVTFGYFDTVHLGTQLLILDICLDRAYKFMDNLWFASTLLIKSWTDKKQRRDSSFCLLLLNIIFFPIVACIIALASALSAPLLPLFTLPIFLVGFPRPSRFWPQTPGEAPASVCGDTGHYEKMAPNLVRSLISGISDGKYAMTLGQGTDLPFFLARSQDKTFWIQTLESGFGYVSLSVKGLELQETSCHALEATRLDDACQVAFQATGRTSCCRTNPYSFFYAVTPIHIEYVDGYSDAKNSLSGIIDYPAAIKQVHHDFLKSLLWLISHLLGKKKRNTATDIQITSDNSAQTERKTSKSVSPIQSISKVIKNRRAVKPMDVPLTGLKSKRSVDKNRKQPKDEFFRKTSMLTPEADPLSPSMKSLGSILTSESDSSTRNLPKPVKLEQNLSSPIPGTVNSEDDLWELDSDLSDSGFGVSMKNVFAKANVAKDKGKTNGNTGAYMPSILDEKDITGWGPVPFNNVELSPYLDLFDQSWYLHVTSLIEDINSGAEEDELLSTCRNVALSCYMLVFVQGIPGRNPDVVGPNHISKVFGGEISWSPELEWLTQRKDLHKVVIQALRYSVKMMYDRVAMGTVDMASDESHDEVVTSLQEYDSSWCIAPEDSVEWRSALKDGIPSLFSIGFDSTKNEHSARVLLRRSVETHVCRTSSASVRGIWANLSLELLYATNDDEERYSIQAHPNLIRNLTVQAADPPLGYPIYSSPPFYENVLS